MSLTLLLAATATMASASEPGWKYGNRGWEWSNPDTGSYLWTGLRSQTRYTTRLASIHELKNFDDSEEDDLRINRARFKVGARYFDDLSFYHEYDLRDKRLLDLRTTWIQSDAFNLRVGQWKAEYNRERIDSSGKQQFVERSIATYWFTIDRQWGALASGRVGTGSRLDSSWWAGVLGGAGRSTESDGGRPMVLGRWQWNYSGELLPFSQSALKRYDKPHASLSLAAVANDSRYTRFSSSGGGQLPGYQEKGDNRYRVYQAMQEWAWQHRGLSFQQELHWKSIRDRREGGERNPYGGYAQVGWFPADQWNCLSEDFEVALRTAYVNPDSGDSQENQEYTLGANWFFSGHRNKLTFDVTYLVIEQDSRENSGTRYQLQWDLSI